MNIEIRKKIYKIPILYTVCQKIVDNNNKRFYKKFNKKFHHDKKLREFKNTKLGKRCFIIGNGPSLNMKDLEMLKEEECFAANLIFRIFDKTDWRPTYYFVQDRYADTGDVLDKLEIPYMFIGDYYWRKRNINNKNALCIHSARSFSKENVEFSNDISKKVISHWTVTYSMIQVAIYMGYTNIYLLGMDHNYAFTYDEKGNIMHNSGVKSHIFEDSNPNEVIANIEGMNKAYISARNFANKNGVKIYNITRGGNLEWFERKKLEEVFRKEE